MSVLSSRPALRWIVPVAAAVAVIGGGAAVGTLAAVAEPSLPERSAAQLLVDLQTAKLDGLSGTVVQRSDLGLPERLTTLSGLAGGGLGSLLAGSNTVRVWYNGPQQARVALLGTLGETDVVRNGKDVWVWRSQGNTADHYKLDADDEKHGALPETAATILPSTPQDAAEQALKAVEPTTEVTTGRNARVAGRDAYELIVAPRDKASLIGQVRLAIDAKEHLPLRVEVYPTGVDEPAFKVEFTQISFAKPDAERFTFNPPPGVKVEEKSDDAGKTDGAGDKAKHLPEGAPGKHDEIADEGMAVVGEGWTGVLVARVSDGNPEAEARKEAGKEPGQDLAQGLELLGDLPKVSGAWGSGRVLESKLFTALLTDDGRALVGAVTPQRLFEVAGSAEGKVK
jgi:outer membrane lipoprotein-sorting protein